ncbi:hypothetical protein TrCOL_g4843 [Triparma columacea]|uniref:HNH nuclease domain-containing protein n=1 Tax=Triparma columacea TaxID=722753 RepID=A0A9W7GNU8_9STRA|nr:hypothetical protein TrCOL_g4843 [Triparma columacea]
MSSVGYAIFFLLTLVFLLSTPYCEGYNSQPNHIPKTRKVKGTASAKQTTRIKKTGGTKKFNVMNRGLARAEDTVTDRSGESRKQIPYSAFPSLVLNADYQPLSFTPLSLWSWQEAIKAVFSGRVTVVESYDVKISSCSITVPLPSVIALHEYVAQDTTPSFTRRNIFLRDNYRCQYCGVKGTYGELTLDHVVPRCKGGGLNWGNAVTACTRCNCLKGSLPLKEAEKKLGHNLRMQPRRPTKRELDRMASRRGGVRVHESWLQYLGNNWGEEGGGVEMKKDKDKLDK